MNAMTKKIKQLRGRKGNAMTLDLETIELKRGRHSSPKKGMCLLEAVSVAAGERFSAYPESTCPVLAAFGRSLNDSLSNKDRTKILRPFIPKLKGTKAPEIELRRAWMATDWLVREFTPAWIDRAKTKNHTDALRSLPEIKDVKSVVHSMRAFIAAKESSGVAWAIAWDAARELDWATGWPTARAWPTAWPTAWTAAWTAAWDAAGDALKPTTESLKTSAAKLYDRMIAITVEQTVEAK